MLHLCCPKTILPVTTSHLSQLPLQDYFNSMRLHSVINTAFIIREHLMMTKSLSVDYVTGAAAT